MDDNVHYKFSSHLCGHCGGPAPDWKCPKCGLTSYVFDPDHFKKCKRTGKMEALCQKCDEAESQCVCPIQNN
ncbi:MAG: hypothetical protein HYX23_00065 [Candidatus Zambryskibacteria bacterium]|nr:hypothetical protein [Candidatus Zambryskibacteria bacterium]